MGVRGTEGWKGTKKVRRREDGRQEGLGKREERRVGRRGVKGKKEKNRKINIRKEKEKKQQLTD